MKILVAKDKFGALRPADPASEEVIKAWGQGELFEIEFRQPRNAKRLRLYWLIMGVVARNLDGQTAENLSDSLKLECGFREPIRMLDGTIIWKPKSISYSKCVEPEFLRYMDKAIMKLCEIMECEPDQLLEAAQSNA